MIRMVETLDGCYKIMAVQQSPRNYSNLLV